MLLCPTFMLISHYGIRLWVLFAIPQRFFLVAGCIWKQKYNSVLIPIPNTYSAQYVYSVSKSPSSEWKRLACTLSLHYYLAGALGLITKVHNTRCNTDIVTRLSAWRWKSSANSAQSDQCGWNGGRPNFISRTRMQPTRMVRFNAWAIIIPISFKLPACIVDEKRVVFNADNLVERLGKWRKRKLWHRLDLFAPPRLDWCCAFTLWTALVAKYLCQ